MFDLCYKSTVRKYEIFLVRTMAQPWCLSMGKSTASKYVCKELVTLLLF